VILEAVTTQTQVSSEQTRQRLLDAAVMEFSEHGYYMTNVDSITQRAGVSHGTFYLYFKNKNDILKAMVQDLLQMVPQISNAVNSQINIQKVTLTPELLPLFEGTIRTVVESLSTASGLMKALVEGMLQSKEIFALSTQAVRDSAYIFKVVLKTVQRKGRYKGCDADILADFMSICIATSILMSAMGMITASHEDLARTITGILYPGFMLEKAVRRRGKQRRTNSEKDKKTRKELIKAAEEELAAKGYFDTTIADIAKRADLSRGTFYLYFKDKDDIIEAVFNNMISRINPLNATSKDFIARLDTSSIDELKRISYQIVDIFDTPFNWAILQGTFCSEKISNHYRGYFSSFAEKLGLRLAALKEQGLCTDVDPVIAAQIILSTVSFSTFLRNMGVLECSKEEYAENMSWFLYYFLNHQLEES